MILTGVRISPPTKKGFVIRMVNIVIQPSNVNINLVLNGFISAVENDLYVS